MDAAKQYTVSVGKAMTPPFLIISTARAKFPDTLVLFTPDAKLYVYLMYIS